MSNLNGNVNGSANTSNTTSSVKEEETKFVFTDTHVPPAMRRGLARHLDEAAKRYVAEREAAEHLAKLEAALAATGRRLVVEEAPTEASRLRGQLASAKENNALALIGVGLGMYVLGALLGAASAVRPPLSRWEHAKRALLGEED